MCSKNCVGKKQDEIQSSYCCGDSLDESCCYGSSTVIHGRNRSHILDGRVRETNKRKQHSLLDPISHQHSNIRIINNGLLNAQTSAYQKSRSRRSNENSFNCRSHRLLTKANELSKDFEKDSERVSSNSSEESSSVELEQDENHRNGKENGKYNSERFHRHTRRTHDRLSYDTGKEITKMLNEGNELILKYLKRLLKKIDYKNSMDSFDHSQIPKKSFQETNPCVCFNYAMMKYLMQLNGTVDKSECTESVNGMDTTTNVEKPCLVSLSDLPAAHEDVGIGKSRLRTENRSSRKRAMFSNVEPGVDEFSEKMPYDEKTSDLIDMRDFSKHISRKISEPRPDYVNICKEALMSILTDKVSSRKNDSSYRTFASVIDKSAKGDEYDKNIKATLSAIVDEIIDERQSASVQEESNNQEIIRKALTSIVSELGRASNSLFSRRTYAPSMAEKRGTGSVRDALMQMVSNVLKSGSSSYVSMVNDTDKSSYEPYVRDVLMSLWRASENHATQATQTGESIDQEEDVSEKQAESPKFSFKEENQSQMMNNSHYSCDYCFCQKSSDDMKQIKTLPVNLKLVSMKVTKKKENEGAMQKKECSQDYTEVKSYSHVRFSLVNPRVRYLLCSFKKQVLRRKQLSYVAKCYAEE